MERENIIILDEGIDVSSMETLMPCCSSSTAAVR